MYYSELRQVRDELTGPGGPFEIVEADILGNRIRTYKNAPPSVREVWLIDSVAFAERPYLIYQDERMTYAEAHAQVNAVAAWLAEQGVQPGDRVAIAMRNYPEWMLIYWACVASGVTAVGMNAWWTTEEMAYALKDSEPKILFLDAERLTRFARSPNSPERVKLVGVRLTKTVRNRISPLVGSDRARWGDARSHGRSRFGCLHFLYLWHHGLSQGRAADAPGCVANLLNMLYAAASSQALAVERATGVAPPATPPSR
jgi:long-chain acyl-CoA synthetase